MVKRHDEDDLQMWCVRWFTYQYPNYAPLLHHSPNGGFRNTREAARFKAMGVRAGFPDLVLLVPNADCPYLCIELKTPKGKVQDTQKMYKEAVTNAGGRYEVVRCFDDFKSIIEDYLGVVK